MENYPLIENFPWMEDIPWGVVGIVVFTMFLLVAVGRASNKANENDMSWDDNTYLRQIRQDIRFVAFLLGALIMLIGAATGLIYGALT
jgi:hypothetical protein